MIPKKNKISLSIYLLHTLQFHLPTSKNQRKYKINLPKKFDLNVNLRQQLTFQLVFFMMIEAKG